MLSSCLVLHAPDDDNEMWYTPDQGRVVITRTFHFHTSTGGVLATGYVLATRYVPGFSRVSWEMGLKIYTGLQPLAKFHVLTGKVSPTEATLDACITVRVSRRSTGIKIARPLCQLCGGCNRSVRAQNLRWVYCSCERSTWPSLSLPSRSVTVNPDTRPTPLPR